MSITIALAGGKSLEDGVRTLFADAGITIGSNTGSTHSVNFRDYPSLQEGIFLKPMRIPFLVENGTCDVGITGEDTVREHGASVEILTRLAFGRSTEGETRGVLFCARGDTLDKIEDIPEGTQVLSEYPRLTRAFFAERGLAVDVVPSPGSAEAEVPRCYRLGVVLSETGRSLRGNTLRPLATLFTSATCLVANTQALANPTKRDAIENLQALLLGVLEARGKILLWMNVPAASVVAVTKILPSLGSPTIAPLADGGSSISTVMRKSEFNGLLPHLRKLGATGFLQTPIGSVIP